MGGGLHLAAHTHTHTRTNRVSVHVNVDYTSYTALYTRPMQRQPVSQRQPAGRLHDTVLFPQSPAKRVARFDVLSHNTKCVAPSFFYFVRKLTTKKSLEISNK